MINISELIIETMNLASDIESISMVLKLTGVSVKEGYLSLMESKLISNIISRNASGDTVNQINNWNYLCYLLSKNSNLLFRPLMV
jgi:hypothetical protein